MGAGERVGLVLAGGGSRGAYEAGVLSVLLPELERRGQRPTVIIGTSAGALNAVILTAMAGHSAEQAARTLVEAWSTVQRHDVFQPVVGLQAPMTALRYLGDVLGVPGVRLPGLLDPAPLRGTIDRLIDWSAVHDNVRDGAVDCVAVAATDAANPRSVVFVEGGAGERELPPTRTIEYVPTELSGEHVHASAAMPVLFPAVHVEQPAAGRGWYYDGGTRLNTPIKPALDLGVDRLVVVATHSVAPRRSDQRRHDARPDFADGAVQLLHATMVDPLTEDVRRLGKTNLLLRSGPTPEALAEHRRTARQPPYREVPYMFIAPHTRDAVGDIASDVFARHFSGHRGLRAPDMAILSRLLGGQSEQHGEIISYVLFEPAFHTELMALGRRDARRWFDRVTGPDAPWFTDPIDTLPDS